MNQDATSFFRGISAKISAAKQSYSSRARQRQHEEQPQQPIAHPLSLPSYPPPPPPLRPTSSPSSSIPYCVGSADLTGVKDTTDIGRCSSKSACSTVPHQEQISSSLMTQVQQTSMSQCRGPVMAIGNMGRYMGAGSSGGRGTVYGSNDNNNNSNDSNSNSTVKPMVHVSAMVERTRKIQGIPKNTSPVNAKAHTSLLPKQLPRYRGKKTLILDLDETLVHSSLMCQPKKYELVLNVKTETSDTTVYVAFRPYLHEFLRAVAPLFEVIIFTASVSIYCDPLMNAVDPEGILGRSRLYREHCSMLNGAYVKDLSLLGRDLDQVAIVDNSPVAYLFQQRNAIPITSWFDDLADDELRRLIPMLEALAQASEVYDVLDKYNAVLQLQQEQMRSDAGQI